MKKISYNPLWVTLINKGIKKKTDLITLAGISSGTLAKMSKEQLVITGNIENVKLVRG